MLLSVYIQTTTNKAQWASSYLFSTPTLNFIGKWHIDSIEIVRSNDEWYVLKTDLGKVALQRYCLKHAIFSFHKWLSIIIGSGASGAASYRRIVKNKTSEPIIWNRTLPFTSNTQASICVISGHLPQKQWTITHAFYKVLKPYELVVA